MMRSIHPVTSEFVGYDNLSYESDVTVLTTETEVVDAVYRRREGNDLRRTRLRSMQPWADRKAIPV